MKVLEKNYSIVLTKEATPCLIILRVFADKINGVIVFLDKKNKYCVKT